MFSTEPMPGNPWPRDMAITIEDDLQPLLEVLWIREAWGLDPEGDDLPPELAAPPSPMERSLTSPVLIRQWTDAWPRVWAAVLQHAGAVRAPELVNRLHASASGSEERRLLLQELIGPSWQDDVGGDAIVEECRHWMGARFDERIGRSRAPLEAQPERAALTAVVDAWRCGLTKIVEIPCSGTFTRRIGAHALLVTAETRADPARYSAALHEFC